MKRKDLLKKITERNILAIFEGTTPAVVIFARGKNCLLYATIGVNNFEASRSFLFCVFLDWGHAGAGPDRAGRPDHKTAQRNHLVLCQRASAASALCMAQASPARNPARRPPWTRRHFIFLIPAPLNKPRGIRGGRGGWQPHFRPVAAGKYLKPETAEGVTKG